MAPSLHVLRQRQTGVPFASRLLEYPMRRLALACSLALMVVAVPAHAESVLRYGISLADIPLTTGQPDRGAGAYQFTGLTIYDPLVAWEMDVADRPG
jgi:peptide/nickel transport system substrate-binding protein